MIIEILEKEALKETEEWAKKRKVIDGRYPTIEEFFEMKNKFFNALCRKAYEETANIIIKR